MSTLPSALQVVLGHGASGTAASMTPYVTGLRARGLAADAIDSLRAGRRHAAEAADGYQRAMRARFRAKDWVSSLVQLFLGEPRLFEYAARRLAARAGPRETIGLVMGDLIPAERGLDPRFLAALLRP